MGLFDRVFRGSDEMLAKAEADLAALIAEVGEDAPVNMPDTAYYCACQLAYAGKKVTNVRELKEALEIVKEMSGKDYNTTNYPKTKTETPKTEKKQKPVTITYDTLYVIRTQYTYSHHLIQSLCVNTHGQVVTRNCSDFTEPGDTLIIITKSNKWHSDEINITRDRIINRYTKQR